MNFEPQWLLYGILFLLALVLIARFGKQLLLVVIMLGVLLLILALSAQATATRQVATAATVSAAGQTAGSVTATMLAIVLVLVLLVAGGAVLYLWLRLRRIEGVTIARRWTPGPNAHWGRTEAPAVAPLEQSLNTLVQLELLHMLRELHGQRQASPALTVEESSDADISWPW